MSGSTEGVPLAVEDDVALGRELATRLTEGPSHWPVPVTDLLDPRSAFFRRFAPVPLPPERRRRRARGSWSHVRWVRRMGPPDRVEAWVQRNGIVGVIDLWEPDGPTELKTTTWAPPMDRWAAERGVYFDQLGLYAALTGSVTGRVVVVSETEEGARGSPQVAACGFRDAPGILQDGEARAERLRRAIRARDPSTLPKCPWFGRRCPYQEAQACDCTGLEPPDDRWVRDRIEYVREDPEAEVRWTEAIAAAEADPPPVLLSFADLVYPRRAYFDRIDPAGPAEAGQVDPESQAAYRDLIASIDGGPPGERSQRPVPTGDPPGSVPLFRGSPFLAKTTRAAPPPDPYPAGLLPMHYRQELEFRCAAVGATEGWIFLLALRSRPPARAVRALRIRWADPEGAAERLESRGAALASALTHHDPKLVPPCPSWRAESCPYRSACGCGPAA